MKSRIKQPLLCLDRLNAVPSISFRSFFLNISNQYKSSHSFISLISFLLSLEKVLGLYRPLLYKAAVHEGCITGAIPLCFPVCTRYICAENDPLVLIIYFTERMSIHRTIYISVNIQFAGVNYCIYIYIYQRQSVCLSPSPL